MRAEREATYAPFGGYSGWKRQIKQYRREHPDVPPVVAPALLHLEMQKRESDAQAVSDDS
jgi:hypothetical protein